MRWRVERYDHGWGGWRPHDVYSSTPQTYPTKKEAEKAMAKAKADLLPHHRFRVREVPPSPS